MSPPRRALLPRMRVVHPAALLALLALACELLPEGCTRAWAQEDGAVKVEDEGEGEAAEAVAGDDAKSDEEKGEDFAKSAQELQDKLNQLRALLDASGDKHPELKEQVANLEKTIAGLGMGIDGAEMGSTPELQEFLGGCILMSMKRIGMRRPSALSGLRQLANSDVKQDEVASNELVRMVAVCINELSDQELQEHKAGKLQQLPKVHVDKAQTEDGKAQVLAIEEAVWKELRRVAAALQKQLLGSPEDNKVNLTPGFLALIPLGIMVLFLVKKFLDMQKRDSQKKEKKDKSDKKKQK